VKSVDHLETIRSKLQPANNKGPTISKTREALPVFIWIYQEDTRIMSKLS
jgi:hypothetical protein